MITRPALFISYRRTQLLEVQRIKVSLAQAGIACFLDVEDIDPLADFPDRIRDAIGRSHAFLAWWSADYGDSDYCQQEFRLAWQHARRRSSDLARRIWIVNPEPRGDHVFSGELDGTNFLKPPVPGDESAWAEALRRRFQELNLIPEGPLADERDAQPAPAFFGVPEKSREFTGRGPELMRIHGRLHPARIGDRGSAVAVQTHGLGGVGKTELAIAYAREFAQAYPGGIYWLNLASWQPGLPAREDAAELSWLRALEQAFRLQPESLRHLTRDADGKELAAAAVRERFARQLGERGAYLWVLDNVPELSPLDIRARVLQFLRAPNGRGHTLLTTRDSRPADGFAAQALEVMSQEDALRLLARHRPNQARDEVPQMRQLISEVGAHTQALILLGEHARNEPGGYPAVLKRLEEVGSARRVDEIAALLRDLMGTRAQGIVATFALSIEPLSAAAREVLSLASVCTPNVPIPETLLAKVFGREQTDVFNRALGALVRASLLQRREASGGSVFIHPLVAQTTVNFLDVDALALMRRVADGLHERLENVKDIRNHSTMLEDIGQARDLGRRLREHLGVLLLLQVGSFEAARGQYEGARIVETQALEIARDVLGEEHPLTLTAMNNLANALHSLGDLGTARALHGQVLSIRRRVLGNGHPETLPSMCNLASTLRAQGDLDAARALQEQALSISWSVLGEEHRTTVDAMSNLADTLKTQGNLGAARAFEEQVLSIRRRMLGEEHSDTLIAMNNLAFTLRKQGDLGAARALQEQGVSISRRVLGAEHPNTLTAMSNLASTLKWQSDLGAAQALQDQVLSIRRRVLGEEHPDTLIAMSSLAMILQAQGNLAAARTLQERALPISQRVLGEEHPDTLTSMNNLAATLKMQGNFAAARPLSELALSIRRRVLGEEHPDTIISIWNLHATLLDAGDLTSALQHLSSLLWLLQRDPSSLGADLQTIRHYVSETRKRLDDRF